MSDIDNTIVARAFNSEGDDDAYFDVQILRSAVVERGMSSILMDKVQRKRFIPLGDAMLDVAVKVVRHTRDQETARQRLQRELEAVQRARHRFIAPFIGAAGRSDVLIIISPLMKSGNLFEYLKRHPLENRQLLLLQVADAVFYLHTCAGMVHGDLKCENVLVSPKGNALLTDFGLSTLIDKPASESTTATSIRRQQTLRFAAPELLQEEVRSSTGRLRSKTTETDVYAFGMLMLQALTGEPPWLGFTDVGVLKRVCDREIHRRPGAEITTLGLTDELWALCISCWSFEPAERPRIDDVRDRIAEVMAHAHDRGRAASASKILECYEIEAVPAIRLRAFRTREPDTAGMIVIRIKRSTMIFFFF